MTRTPAESSADVRSLLDEIAVLRDRVAVLEAERAGLDHPQRDATVDLLELLLDTSPVGIGFLDTDFRFRRVNRALAELNSLTPEQHVGRSIRELFPAIADEIEAPMRQVLETRQPVLGTERIDPMPGHEEYRQHLLVDYYPVLDARDELVGIGVTLADISARKQSEQFTQSLAEVSQIFAAAAPDIAETLDTVARTLVDRLGDACVVWLLSDDRETRYVASMHHSDPDALALMRELEASAPPQSAASWSLQSEQPEFFPVVPPDTLHQRVWKPFWPYVERYPPHSIIAIPMVVRGRMIGAIRLSREITPYAYAPLDFQFAIELTQRAALAIDNARLFAAEQEARRLAEGAEARYRGIFESSADALIIIDGDHCYVDANPAATQLYGYSREELIGRPAGGLLPESDPLRIEAYFAEVLRTGHWRGESDARRKDGSTIPVEGVMSVVSLGTGDDQQRVFISSTRDISERRRLERLQQEFISMVTHELKIPLTGIRGYAQLMHRRAAFSANGVAAILEQADRLERLINDLLDSARLEAGRLDIHLELIDLVAIVREAVDGAKALTDEHTFVVHGGPQSVFGMFDRGRTQQIVGNLLSNAVKYSPAGGEIGVRLTVDGHAREVIVSVRDEGVGIAPDDLPSLFSRFTRLESAVAADAPGLGLGLYITRSLVEAQGGRIWAESTQGAGSTFSFALPLDR